MTEGTQKTRRIIVLLADGTGNSAGKLSKTNVWRLYQALDLRSREELDAGDIPQIAYYHDGVGTSSFRLFAMLGGAFGWGLKRNVLDFYKFLCRNYQSGDAVFAFGFSRGAFTIRMLIGLVLNQGISQGASEEHLELIALDAYREYRAQFDHTPRLVKVLRPVRDLLVAIWRRLLIRARRELVKVTLDEVAFVGVWDTVAAYGTPLDELTRGIDRWIWPLSMPNYRLARQVARARHALSLDDERDTFHPLLWDELHERELRYDRWISADRLRQVWFAGMHSDIGGGYPDDALSYVALDWMMEEAGSQMKRDGLVGLRFKPDVVGDIKRAINPSAPMHDSRAGLASYYRYQPRKISALIEPPDPSARIMRDPALDGHGLLLSVKIHESVFARIKAGLDRYAPLVLPGDYEVVRALGTVTAGSPEGPNGSRRAARQEWVWNDVWRKRINYFLTVAASAVIAFLPSFLTPTACVGPQCLLAPVISAAGFFVPGFAQPWIETFAQHPLAFVIAVLGIALLMLRASSLRTRIHQGMRELWEESLELPRSGLATTTAGTCQSGPRNWIYRLRNSDVYERSIQYLKWRVAPTVFGLSLLLLGLLAIPGLVANRIAISLAERSNELCPPAGKSVPSGEFATKLMCWSTGVDVKEGMNYRVTLSVINPWVDSTIDTNPLGFGSERLPWYFRYEAPLIRRSFQDRWFQPLVKVVDRHGSSHIEALAMQRADPGASVFTGQFKAERTGNVFLFVNDAVIYWPLPIDSFYENNKGTAAVTIEPVVSSN